MNKFLYTKKYGKRRIFVIIENPYIRFVNSWLWLPKKGYLGFLAISVK